MSKRIWLKAALLVLSAGTALGLGFGGGCLQATVQRLLVSLAFD